MANKLTTTLSELEDFTDSIREELIKKKGINENIVKSVKIQIPITKSALGDGEWFVNVSNDAEVKE